MKHNQRKKYKRGTLVFVEDTQVLKNNFSHWPTSQVFKVADDEVSTDKKRYIWLDSYSQGLKPDNVRMTSKKERDAYNKEL